MGRVLTWLRRLFVGTAAVVALVLATLLVVEESGLLARLVQARLARELGNVGARLSVQHASLAWFEPGIELVGISLAPPEGAGTPDLELQRLHVSLALGLDALRSVRIDGGRLLLGRRLFDEWNRLALRRSEQTPAGPPGVVPPGSVTGLEVALELFDGSRFQLGTVDLCARPGPAGGIELAGRLAPSLGGAISSPIPIRINGAITDTGARLWASARELALESRSLPSGALAHPLPLTEGSAVLTLDSAFELVFADSARPHGHLRASLRDGAFLVRPDLPRADELALDLEADLAPQPGSDPWTREAWDARGTLRARVGATRLWAQGDFGRNVPEDGWLRVWGGAQDFSLDPADLSALSLEEGFGFVRTMLDPRGRLDLAWNARMGREADTWTHDVAVHARSEGEVQLAYQGYPGDADSGLPLPLTNVGGELVVGIRSNGLRPWRFAAPDLSADHGSGRMNAWVQVTAPPRDSQAEETPELDLVLSTPAISVDDSLRSAVARNRHLSWIEPAFSPEHGTLAGDFRLRSGADVHGTSAAGTLRFHGVSMRWEDVPVPLENVRGEVTLRWAPEVSVARGDPLVHARPVGVAYLFDNRGDPRIGAQARVQGWLREAPLPPIHDPTALAEEYLQEIRVDIDELGLRGRDFDILATRFPALEREVNEYGAVGLTRVSFRGAHTNPSLAFRSEIEATPLVVHVRPQFFQRQTRDLRGRILIQTQTTPLGDVNSAQVVLAGTWPVGVELFAYGKIPETGDADVQVYGAGIDPSNTSFKGALVTSLSEGSASSGSVDLSSWTLKGGVDFALETRFDPASPAPPRNRYRFQLRDNVFIATDLVLRDLRGTFTQEDDVLSSARVEATLGGHPLELRNVLTFPLSVLPRVRDADARLGSEGFWKDPAARALQAEVFLRDLPLDVEHLEGLLEPSLLASLRENSSWSGLLDVQGARLLVTTEANNQGKTALRGAMRVHDMALVLGLPIRISTARIDLKDSIIESGRLRGWASITGLDARIAERELADASMIAGYVDGRLTIDNLSGDFEGGRLESLGGALGGASKALGIDLAEPHRFDVALRMQDVGVGGLLRGVFQSSIADEGVLDASLQLSGTPGKILELTGRGDLSLDEGALWSIPVMRELFQQLGFDKGGLFDRLRSRFELRDGRLQVSHLEIQSSLLDLVGEGWQDLDGQLSYDLEVRYGLLDRLGPFGRLLYWLNNSLMRVAVRGDFERPVVRIRNSIVELLTGFDDRPPRRLPLPAFSALGSRF